MRVVSLLPAATEMMYALGLGDELVAVSHDCDHPASVAKKPQITHCEIHGAWLSNAEVDQWVRRTLAERGTLYTIDEPLLRSLEPDVILTQKLCDVCAPSYGSVAHLAATLPTPPQVVNLEPSRLVDIFANIRAVAEVLGAPELGDAMVTRLERRVGVVRNRTRSVTSPRCIVLEWLDPPFCSGHWGPELVELAGGYDPLGRKGSDSSQIPWQAVLDSRPEVLVLACCGNSVARTLEELPALKGNAGWQELPAVRNGRVFALDGSAYFSRPGPRVVDSLELLAGILHPELFPEWGPDRQPPNRVTRIDAAALP
ncbi:MAG: cobalamin-binding protein [Trueperaceae bacterium]